MSCGVECPYEGPIRPWPSEWTAFIQLMKQRDLDIRRLRLTAICTVCNRAFLNEVNEMNDLVQELGPPDAGSRRPTAETFQDDG